LIFGLSILVTWLLSALVAGSMVYCVLVIIAVRHYLHQQTPRRDSFPPVSVLLFAFRHSDDPASPIVRKLLAEFPHVPANVIITGEPPYPNAKVFSLHLMQAAAQFELLVMKDSDVRTGPDMLEGIAGEFQDARVGMVTCPYVAIAERGF
jgi:ceramide glucosyltransferase